MKAVIDICAESHFPLQNLPFGAYVREVGGVPRLATALGEYVVDLCALAQDGVLEAAGADVVRALQQPTLNEYMGYGREVWKRTRAVLQSVLADTTAVAALKTEAGRAKYFVPMSAAQMVLPVAVGDYTDFYSSREHATNVGIMFRGKDNALMPNWLHLPVGYHGRASSLVVSGTPVRRPMGQSKADTATAPEFHACRMLDFELETGFYVGPGNALGDRIHIEDADNHIFGVTLLNDWSARDIQKWEYVPLGPFTAKNFASTLSPWIVTLEALEPFRVASPVQEPEVLPYLQDPKRESLPGGYDIQLEVLLATPQMTEPAVISRSNLKYMYWTMRQQLVQHSVTGCNMRTGDLLGSGTISGPTQDSYGSMLEICWKGERPLTLPNGESRKSLLDGDTLILSGFCQGEGFRVGFGQAKGTILPAKE